MLIIIELKSKGPST